MKKTFTAVLLLISTFAAAGRTLYVSCSGNDKNPGTQKAPAATIACAVSKALPGDTVRIGPGIYREQITFTRSGKKGAPITIEGTRGKNGEYLTIVEGKGTVLSKWVPAPEIAPDVWKTKLPRRPGIVMLDGRMIALVNHRTTALKRRAVLPKELQAKEIWGAWGPKCPRLSAFDLLSLPKDIQVAHPYFGKRKEYFWPVLNYILSCWNKGYLYLRFANGSTPAKHKITAAAGECFTLKNVHHLKFTDLHMRGSRCPINITGKSSFINVENSLLMHGGVRVSIDRQVRGTVVRNNIMTAGFIRDDLFGLRSDKDMRGGLLYLIFKYIIGTTLSDDAGVSSRGKNTLLENNTIIRGLIGIRSFGPGAVVRNNVVREMSSVGICTGPDGDGRFYENIIMNCGIPLRIHRLRERRRKPLRIEYHYRNLFVQAPHGGGNIFVHCASQLYGDDAINFEKDKKGRYVYKKNPPAPVDPGRFYIYHNTFWGGQDGGYGLMVTRLARMFRSVMPFYFINNIVKFCPRHDGRTVDAMEGNLFYLFAPSKLADRELRDPGLYKVNRSTGVVRHEKIWNSKGKYGLPDVTVFANSPAAGCGIDITGSKVFKGGRRLPKLPGFAPGYFKGKAPAAGVFQPGESQEKFYVMHLKAEKALQMLKQK